MKYDTVTELDILLWLQECFDRTGVLSKRRQGMVYKNVCRSLPFKPGRTKEELPNVREKTLYEDLLLYLFRLLGPYISSKSLPC